MAAGSPPCICMWRGGKIGYVPLRLISTVKDADIQTWCLVETGCSSELVINEDEANKLCTSIRDLYTVQGIHHQQVPACRTDGKKFADNFGC